jgi:tRNA threonylcarbamoyladenosine biosynthesis protein TsaB
LLLAIDTSTRYAGVALADDQRVVDCRWWFSTQNHTAELMPAVAEILQRWGLKPSSLDAIAVALGPGGFSALRVGLSAAKGMALAAKLPLVGVGTLDLEAFPFLESGLPVCSLLDAGRSETASAHFGADGRRLREDWVCPPEELLEAVRETTLFCGEGVQSCTGLVRERLGRLAVVVHQTGPATRLGSLVELSRRRLAAGEFDDLAALQPYYLRMPTIGGPKRRDRIPQR